VKWRKRTEGHRPKTVPKPSIPTEAPEVPAGPAWIHEIKHDGYRLMVERKGDRVRIITRMGFDWTDRYPLIVEAALARRSKSFVLDGEGVVSGPDGVADFAMLHSRQHDVSCFLYAFDLLEEDGEPVRKMPLELRKERLKGVLGGSKSGIVLSDYAETDGAKLFKAACKMGLEGIVSKRRDRAYFSGRCKHWIKVKNPRSPAVLRFET
jgi:ATP-dependent DNA ligase